MWHSMFLWQLWKTATQCILGMMLALLLSHLLWRLFPQQRFCWCLSPCFCGIFFPIKLVYLARKTSTISCKTIPAKHRTYTGQKLHNLLLQLRGFCAFPLDRPSVTPSQFHSCPQVFSPPDSSGLPHSLYADPKARKGKLPATTQVTSPQDSTPWHITASLAGLRESWVSEAEQMQTGRCLQEASARVMHLVPLLATFCQANRCAWCLLASSPAFFLS